MTIIEFKKTKANNKSDFSELEKRFDYNYEAGSGDGKHKPWQKLHSDASKSHSKAFKELKEDTTGLKYNDMITEFSKYISMRDNGKSYDKLSEYEQRLVQGEAIGFVKAIADENKMSLNAYVTKLHKEGIDEIIGAYHGNKKQQTTGKLIKSFIHEVNPMMKNESLFKGLKDAKSSVIEGEEDFDVKSNIETYLTRHVLDKQDKSQKKYAGTDVYQKAA